ncbi:hypothetical protein EDD11_007276 [Mortierella claussenii]|nr:hypothetical protein EDD11_007276 [Mortierella claussenii]
MPAELPSCIGSQQSFDEQRDRDPAARSSHDTSKDVFRDRRASFAATTTNQSRAAPGPLQQQSLPLPKSFDVGGPGQHQEEEGEGERHSLWHEKQQQLCKLRTSGKNQRNTTSSFTFNCSNVYPHVEDTLMLGNACPWGDVTDDDDDEDADEDVMLLRKMLCLDHNGSDTLSFSSPSLDPLRENECLIEFGRKPQVFDGAESMIFYISPLAITQLATGLWMRSRPACVIINTGIPRGTRFDDMNWSPDALRMLHLPNAGGSSLLSEVLSCEMLSRCLGASLANTEMEIRYLFAYQPITDYTIILPNLSPKMHVGVSVTRAFAFKGAYRRADCRKLLWKKLMGILASTRNVVGEKLFKQILHVWVPNGKVARTVQATYKSLPIEVTRNTVVIVSVVNASWVFSNLR